MKRNLIGPAALLMSALFAHQANAADAIENVQSLLGACKAGYGTFGNGYCLGYVGGFADAMVDNELAAKQAGLGRLGVICVSDPSPTYGAYVQAFVNWAQAHPANWQESKSNGVLEGLSQTWPCP
ncbi:hypothetical protein BPNPMPFG_000313 [Mesorhizobium sp. AR07]|uniref:Rap1a/Tai family immunity protein n=1 Tax=Mesorhizobium sp. AR07 TaxID=2865838 RepID=UPI002160DE74|nr:Rap1a/Tai family immunity protein [Mesorhizobium sp. AR07]UVK44848.1 hypothetical protein BPNPMPFG_000313 [Mesorhizobium sp. AR07]